MTGRGKGSSPRIKCVNCNICVNTLHRYLALELNTRAVSLLCNWVYPQIITEDDVICEACRDLAMSRIDAEVITDVDQQAPQRQQGHPSVCRLCGRSTLQRQSDRILRDNPTELHQSMINIIVNRVAPQQITASDCVCHACWLKTQREARRINLQDEARPYIDVIKEEPPENDDQPSETNQADANVFQDKANPSIDVVKEEVINQAGENSQKVHIPGYRRASNSNNLCVFPNCNSVTLRGISDKLRAIVLSNHRYYLPPLVRVCDAHLTSNSWDILYDLQNSHSTFTPEQIQHVFSFVNASE